MLSLHTLLSPHILVMTRFHKKRPENNRTRLLKVQLTAYTKTPMAAPFRPLAEQAKSAFDRMSRQELDNHLAQRTYGDFTLPDGITPAPDFTPIAGYRHDTWQNEGYRVPCLIASVTRAKLFEVFLKLTDLLGSEVDVILETSHGQRPNQGHKDMYREGIDLPILQSTLWSYEDLLTHDGCTGIAVMNSSIPMEVQFDEHKLLMMYGAQLNTCKAVLRIHAIAQRKAMLLITDGEHIHLTSDAFESRFRQLAIDLGVDQY